ncbi:MAG: ROK family protein [Verrucomicrobiales bacterium]|jgi:glucokinase|nr:ROK family protein [Verrucomicrobiales bacterium]MBP9224273.1 ROK family protein [Verrucomicrobiales bacterium]HQZ27263.1 ROK family protein [Verrucomicrobiales bacterium]
MNKKKPSYPGRVWIGFDLGGTKMLAKVFNDDYQTLGRAKQKTLGAKGAKHGLTRMVSLIEEALDDAGADPTQLAGIGVGCPGPINPEKGEIVEAPNLGWTRVPVEAFLSKTFSCRTVICNDVDAGVYAEYTEGAARGARCAVGIFPGTGIGAGAVINGRLLQGAKLSCMELGHIPLYPETSGSGEDGSTLETECSRLKIAIEASRAAYRGQAPNLLKACGTDISKITSGALAKAIEAGDKEIEEIVRRAATLLGCGVATVVHLLAPDLIVLGGGLVEAMPELYLEAVKKSAVSRVLGPYKKSFKIVTAELEEDAGVMGAAAWARKTIEG